MILTATVPQWVSDAASVARLSSHWPLGQKWEYDTGIFTKFGAYEITNKLTMIAAAIENDDAAFSVPCASVGGSSASER